MRCRRGFPRTPRSTHRACLVAREGVGYTPGVARRLAGKRPFSTSAPWVFLPALGSPLAHAPVLRWDLMPTLNRPISKRLFGANKTWRGALMMNAGTVPQSSCTGFPPTAGAYRTRAVGVAISLFDQADW